jgi:tRNA dimethylallyltransferase
MPAILVIAGPTAVGKTALGVRLAEEIGAEIVSIDSRQLYRELKTGTGKPTAEERATIVHHLVDTHSITESVSAGKFVRLAEACIHDIQARGKTPLVVGGSTLYLAALIHGLSDVPDIDPGWRSELMVRLEREGAGALFEELKQVDPASAIGLDVSKTQRLVRALEVYHATGQPLSTFHKKPLSTTFAYRTLVLHTDRVRLYSRIEERVDRMLAAGLVDEVRGLLAQGFSPELPALRTIGYQEPLAWLRGEIDEAEMVRLMKRNTRRYAKRQLTWFRRFPEYRWVEIEEALRRPTSLLGE